MNSGIRSIQQCNSIGIEKSELSECLVKLSISDATSGATSPAGEIFISEGSEGTFYGKFSEILMSLTFCKKKLNRYFFSRIWSL